MLKKGILGVIMLMFFSLLMCKSPKGITHDFPPEMKPEIKAEYIKLFEKGKILYNINCSMCHTKKVRGKEIIPDFTSLQLEAYQVRISNPQHEDRMTENSVSAEDLSLIVTFLTYKKKDKAVVK